MAAFFALALAIGLWPVHADVFGAPSYSCGSGFIYSSHHWKVDSASLTNSRVANDTGQGTPSQICPNKVYSRRDFSLLLGSFALVVGVLALILIQNPQDRSRSALQASMRVRDASRR